MPIIYFTYEGKSFTCLWDWSPKNKPDADFQLMDLVVREGIPDDDQESGSTNKKRFRASPPLRSEFGALSTREPLQGLSSAKCDEHLKDSFYTDCGDCFLRIMKNVSHVILPRPEDLPGHGTVAAKKQRFDENLVSRLCVPMALPSEIKNTRLAVVGRFSPTECAEMTPVLRSGRSTRQVAARDYQGLVPPPPQLPGVSRAQSIVTALSAKGPFDGIITLEEHWLDDTAKAAAELGLRSMSHNLIERISDRYTVRLLSDPSQKLVRVAPGEYDQDALKRFEAFCETSGRLPEFPVTLTPCTRHEEASYGYRAAANTQELVQAFAEACTHGAGGPGTTLLIGHHEDGPKVDTNPVMQDGEILFFELVDSFPTSGDRFVKRNEREEDGSGVAQASFLETNLVWPSQHPQKEQDLVRDAVHKVLLELGARDGVFHAEARIRNSAVHYASVQEEVEGGKKRGRQLIDLVPRPAPPAEEPSVALLEIKPMPPSYGGLWGTRLTYGADYSALYMMCALGERERFRALSQPFPAASNMERDWVNCVYFNLEAGRADMGFNIMAYVDEKLPHLKSRLYFGKFSYGFGNMYWEERLAVLGVVSTESRGRALEMANQIRDAVESKIAELNSQR
ncbi:uncharacterized protein PG986_011643 [Apiospora aurea]|uniref:Uncharacterized protein n=1 Tax=Apiospora aurea TaxID=335848 RepID=A0ABR1PY10_9PEZI